MKSKNSCMAKSKFLKLIDITGDVVLVNLDDVSFVSVELGKTVRIKFKGSDEILHFENIIEESIDAVYRL